MGEMKKWVWYGLTMACQSIPAPFFQTGEKGIYLKQRLMDKLVEHKQHIAKHGQDLPEIRDWKWSGDTDRATSREEGTRA